jgi:5-methylthioribose kinase
MGNCLFSLNLKTSPFVRTSPGFKLDQIRGNFEREYLALNGEIYPGTSPKIYFYDVENSYVCMEYLIGFTNFKEELIKGRKNENFSEILGSYFAVKSFKTSNLSNKSHEMLGLTSRFRGNFQIRELLNYLNFKNGYNSKNNKNFSEKIQNKLNEIQSSSEIKFNVASLELEMKENVQCICHGDFHTGSVLMKEDQIYIIDSEAATVGPIAYDIGILFGNVILGYCFQTFFEKVKGERSEYQKWILKAISDCWNIFEKKFTSHWRDVMDVNFWDEKDFKFFQDEYVKKIMKSAIGYMGIILLRGATENWPEYSYLQNEEKETVSVYLLSVTKLILSGGFDTMNDVLNSIEQLKIE